MGKVATIFLDSQTSWFWEDKIPNTLIKPFEDKATYLKDYTS